MSDMNDMMDDLFRDAEKDNIDDVIKSKTFAEKVIDKVEDEFTGFSEEHKSRQKERADLREKMAKLRKDINRCKNIKVPSKLHLNKGVAEKRAKLKAKLDFCKLRLDEIDAEEQGPGA